MTEPATAPAPPAATGPQPLCQNCGAPLLGEHCYACGQPVKGLVRHFTSILGDFLDSVLNIDSRIFHTLWPLFARPGYLSREYFVGHRVRYVSPVRLFVFLSIVTFFVAQLVINIGDGTIEMGGDEDRIGRAMTVADVERERDEAIRKLAVARHQVPAGVPGARAGIDAGDAAIRKKAQARIDALQGAARRGEPPPPPVVDKPSISFGDKGEWDAKTNPLKISWLPEAANRKLNQQVGHFRDNVRRGEQDPNLIKDAVLSTVPTTLFVMLPLFALMLKFAYAFKRRLYMEHLIVALHSHAFLCLALLGMFLLMALQDWVGASRGALHSLIRLGEVALAIWMPVYLLIMQKRVYGQGWAMTVLKYCLLGLCYSVLLSIGAAFTMLAGLVWM